MSEIDPTSLDSLVDIVVPPPAGWWPLAPGWLLVLLAIGLAGLVRLAILLRDWRRNAYRRDALRELDRIAGSDGRTTWTKVPELLKRTALAAWPRADVAGLSGTAWVEFLNHTGRTPGFGGNIGERLLALSYEPGAVERFSTTDFQQVVEASRDWIRHHARPEAAPC
ncbi:hypothetical protein Pan44_46080 [Caulifigura coniformis]|uniref:DUF4381 domain-containing protein n=1 Tax=Caulifigura coniformis TaxID=2527983 RepID=A0A517SKA3_9PLAN|nr:DUF4381 domain-containing protein [Caulifigura coniformis]QDT56552.1 hypothetical protein Pan44_46080 [Caulifigura coniformis]